MLIVCGELVRVQCFACCCKCLHGGVVWMLRESEEGKVGRRLTLVLRCVAC